MVGGLTLWELLAQSWPLVWPLARVRDDIGADRLDQAIRLGLVRRTALQVGMDYPCPRLCPMRLVEDDGLVAVCSRTTDRCADEPIAPADAFQLEVDTCTMTAALQRMLRLAPAAGWNERVAIVLGTRRIGRQGVRCVLVPRPQLITDWVERTAREDPDRVLVMITFTAAQVPSRAPRRVDHTRVEWVALEEALDAEGRLDLSDLWIQLAPPATIAADLWPRYAFVVDESRDFWSYAGARLALDRSPLEARLLGILLRKAGAVVCRRDLIFGLWQDDVEGPHPPTVDVLDQRLRQLRADLAGRFRRLALPDGVPRDPIVTVRVRSDTAGGYRVDVEPERVLFV